MLPLALEIRLEFPALNNTRSVLRTSMLAIASSFTSTCVPWGDDHARAAATDLWHEQRGIRPLVLL